MLALHLWPVVKRSFAFKMDELAFTPDSYSSDFSSEVSLGAKSLRYQGLKSRHTQWQMRGTESVPES